MSTQLQLRRGTTVQHSTFTGATGEITCDSTKYTAVIHDGITPGGYPLQKEFNAGSGLFFNGSTLHVSGSIITGGGAGGTGAPITGKYLVLQNSANLTDERLFTPGTGLVAVDGGANSTYTINFNTGILTGYVRSGQPHSFLGSLNADDHIQYIYTGANSDTRNTIVSTNDSIALNLKAHVTQTKNLLQVVNDSDGVKAGISSAFKLFGQGLDAQSQTINSVADPVFTDDAVNLNYLTGNFARRSFITGSTGISAIVSGEYVVITYTGTSTAGAPADSSYIVIGTNATLTNERAIAMGTGLVATDGGANSNYTINFNTGILTGYLLTGLAAITYAPISSSFLTASAEGTLTAERRLVMGTGLASVDGGANGNYTINFNTGILTGYLLTGIAPTLYAPIDPTYLVLSNNSLLTNERAVVFNSGLTVTDGGANSTYTIGFNTGFITGNLYTGNLSSYLTGGTGITVTQSGSYLRIDANSIPSYASPISIQGLAANATASNTAIIMLQAQTNTNYRNVLAPGEVLVITNAYMRVPFGTGSSNAHIVSGGIRTYTNPNVSTVGTDSYFFSCTGMGDNYGHSGVTASYYNPLFLLTGGHNPNTTGGWNLLLLNSSPAVRPLSNSGTVFALNGYIVPSGRYP